MSAGIRVQWDKAAPIAWALEEMLAPACERIAIAGSIRRGFADVGDIEILAIPKTHEEPAPSLGMFDAGENIVVNDLAAEIVKLHGRGILRDAEDHKAAGERYIKSIHVQSGLQVDLFMVRPPATWGVLFLIRTGPAAYSQWFVTEARRRGFHITDGQLHKGTLGCGSRPCPVVDTPDEESVYSALGLPWLRPEDRS